MSKRPENAESAGSGWGPLSRIGVVVHPNRDVGAPLRALRDWSDRHGVDVLQVPVPGQRWNVAQLGDPSEVDLIVSIGGDGTMLAAIRAAAVTNRPVLGVACGSLGVLTRVGPAGVERALQRISQEDWVPLRLPAVTVAREDGESLFAVNDVAVVRSGEGQVHTAAWLDGVMFGRFVGDGYVVSTPTGSSGYGLAAGGPLLAPGLDGFLLTPVSAHGGRCPPIVIGAESALQLEAVAGHGGARLELDGQVSDARVGSLTVTFRPAAATLAGFADQEPVLTVLRRRQIIIDSPRILAEDARG